MPPARRTSASAIRVVGCSGWWLPRMSRTSTGGSPRPSIRVGQRQAPQRHDALGPRRGAAGEQHGAVLTRPAQRDRPGVVARVALVLVGRVVLLVDDDQPDVGQRREHRRARPDADPGLAVAQAQPLVVSLALAEPRVQHRDDVAQPGPEPRQRLRRQCDLGDEHDRGSRPAPGRASTARRYTSVLPEPVTPCSSSRPPSSGPRRCSSAASTSSRASPLVVGQRRRRTPGATRRRCRPVAAAVSAGARRRDRASAGGEARASRAWRRQSGRLARAPPAATSGGR